MKKGIIYIMAIISLSCSQSIDLDLPIYQPQLTVEFYLEEGKPLRCLLQESLPYTDDQLFKILDDALVVLKYNGIMDTLENRVTIDSTFNKAYNYYNSKIFKADTNTEYQLHITDSQGRELTAITRYNEPVKIDSVAYDFNDQEEARIGIIFTDPAATKNYYRIVAFPTDTIATEDETWDITLADNTFNGMPFSFFTGFTYIKGRSVLARLYSLNEEHYTYTESVSTARQSNFNPFGQPAPLRGNIEGGLGIFTVLSYDKMQVNIE